MEILYNYKPYPTPRKAVYRQDTEVYKLTEGWLTKEVETTVIGECDDCYVEILKPTGHGEWVGENVVNINYLLPLGFHKSRLVRWVEEGQLQLAV